MSSYFDATAQQNQRRFVRPTLSLLQFNALVAGWLAFFLNFQFFSTIKALSSLTGFSATLFITTLALVLFFIYFFVLQLFSWRVVAKGLAIALIVIGGLSSYFVSQLGIDITVGQITNAMQTDTRETLDLLSLPLLQWAFLTIFVPVLVISYIKIKVQPLKKVVLTKLIAIPLSLILMLGLAFIYYAQLAPIFREHRYLKAEISPLNSLSSLYSYSKSQLKSKHKTLVPFGTDAKMTAVPNSQTAPQLMVLVVGETARAESFSLNGYARDTNPQLSKLDILNFKNASSCGTATAVSVPCMFSGMSREHYDASLAESREGLLDIAQRAGYQVTWIDNNSGCKRTCDRVHQFSIPEALKQKWCKDGECYDELLVDSLKLYLDQLKTNPPSQNQLIVLHQAGSHGPAYYKRYPDAFKKFTPTCDTNNIQDCSHEALLNTYDNTIVYTDYVLSEVINTLKQQKTYQTAMWYLSDHGESTGEHGLYLHGAPYLFAPSQQTKVPMILWFSDAWQKQQPQVVPCLKQQLSLPRGQDNLFPSMLSLLHVNSKTINPELDMRSTCLGSKQA